ncbi:MAG: zinc-ribbon domain-containing protein [candidate division WOR-3 bacterium]
MKHCIKCGKPNEDEALFCIACGNPFPKQEQEIAKGPGICRACGRGLPLIRHPSIL